MGGATAGGNAFIRPMCATLAVLAVLVGGGGMVASFLFMTSQSMGDITAGAAGFVAGAVLIGSGLISLALLASATPRGAGQ